MRYDIDRTRRKTLAASIMLGAATALPSATGHAQGRSVPEHAPRANSSADKEGHLDCLVKLSPLVRPGGLIVAHNMHSPPPDPRYLEAVTTNPALETVFLNMHDAGVGVTLKKR